MALLLTDRDVQKLLTMKDAMEVIEDVFRERGFGRTFEIPRSRIYAPMEQHHSDFWMNAMAAAVPKLKVGAMRLSTGATQAMRTKEKMIVSRKTDRTLLYSAETGAMLAIIHNDYLQKLRVGASTGVAVKYMARKDAETVGVFGSGRQARTNLMAIAMARKIARVKVYSPTKAHCEAYCQEMREVLNVDVAPASAREVVKGADIVLAASNSRVPVFQGEWLEKGTNVNAVLGADRIMAGSELDSETMIRADVICVNAKEQIHLDNQRRFLDLIEHRQLSPNKIFELGDVVAGKVQGRMSDDQITVYDNNVGMGIQFAACGAFVLQKAQELGLGRELPDADFNEYADGVADVGLSHELIKPDWYSKPGMKK